MSRISSTLQPGSAGWLLAHDLLLSWRRFRSMFGGYADRTVLIILICAIIVFHLLAWPVAHWMITTAAGGENERQFYPVLASAVLFVMPWLTSQALTGTTRALYTRNDLDLLLASPLPPRFILFARALAIACESIGSVAIFLLPIANMNAILGGWRWLAVYPVLIAMGLICTATGIILTLLLFRIAGPRRTRMLAQIFATVVGASFIFLLQAANILPDKTREALVAAIETPGSGWLWLPVRAAAGQWDAVILWCAAAIVIFTAAALLLGERFAISAVTAAGQASAIARAPRLRGIRFREGLGRALRQKEWRLLGRDPWLLSQILLQVIYTLPVSIVIWRSQGPDGSLAISIAPAVVVIASQISASLAWLTISGEDAPEFLMTAPVARRDIERRKMEAVAVPLLCFLAAPLAVLAWSSFEMAFYTAVFAAGACLSTAFLNFWHPMPGRRNAMLRRHSQSKLIALVEHLLSLFWALAMVLCVIGSPFTLLILLLIAFILWANRPKTKTWRADAN